MQFTSKIQRFRLLFFFLAVLFRTVLGIADSAKYNQERFKQYENVFSQIISKIDERGLRTKLRKIELETLYRYKLRPVTYPFLVITKEYITPARRHWYSDSKIYSITESEVKAILKEREIVSKQATARQATIEYERSLMTPKLRYEVMRRDGFRCCICGSSRSDGVKLHVDHIRPVSKGGKTELSNLRTLCDRCNLGKSDSYYEGELN